MDLVKNIAVDFFATVTKLTSLEMLIEDIMAKILHHSSKTTKQLK
jgi:hypothetical protein